MSTSSLQLTSLHCVYMPITSYAPSTCGEECSLLLCRREAEESSSFGTDTSMISEVGDGFDCKELLCKPEEEISQVSSPAKNRMQCMEEEEDTSNSQNFCEESLLSLHYSSGSEDSRTDSDLFTWLSYLDDETEEHFHSMTRIQQREIHLRHKMALQKTEEALNPYYMMYRPLLLEWLCDVCMELALTPETLHTAVYLLDSFVLKQKIDSRFLQPLSCACILVAGKQEEREENVPRVEELVYLCRHSFSSGAIVTMEKLLLEVLDWNVLTCNVIHFLRFFLFQWCQICNDRLQEKAYSLKSQELGEVALYLANRAMIYESFMLYSPSCLAAASVYSALLGFFGEQFLRDAFNLHVLWTDHDIFMGEHISNHLVTLKTWLFEEETSQTTCSPIRVCSPTCIQQMSFKYNGLCTSFDNKQENIFDGLARKLNDSF